MKEVSIKDIVVAASGKDALGLAKASIGVIYEKLDLDGNSKIVRELSVDKPLINIYKGPEYVQVDVTFSSVSDIDLIMINELLLTATDAQNSIEDNPVEFPTLSLTIVPHEFDGEYYLLCLNPMLWCLTTLEPNGEATTLRFVFNENDFFVLASEPEALNEVNEELEEELEKEIKDQDYYAEREAEIRSQRQSIY